MNRVLSLHYGVFREDVHRAAAIFHPEELPSLLFLDIGCLHSLYVNSAANATWELYPWLMQRLPQKNDLQKKIVFEILV